MIEAVYFGTLIPLLFLIVVIKGEYRRLILFFAWGLTSAMLVYLINIAIDNYLELEQRFFLTQVVPLIEEFMKVLPVMVLISRKHKTTQLNIVRFAMAAGIGFAILENYLYLSFMVESGLATSIVFIITRSLSASLLHGCLTALIGYALGIMKARQFFSISLLLGMFLLAATIHSPYNYLGLSENLKVFGILIPLLVFLLELYLFNFFGHRRVARRKKTEVT
jgi:RsiW-degrading membrane proteinase PrsW (M82 family)